MSTRHWSNRLVTPVGGHITGAVYIPFSAADMSPYASQVVADGGFLVDGDTTAVGIRLGKALLEQGFKEPVEYNGTTWDAAYDQNQLRQSERTPTLRRPTA